MRIRCSFWFRASSTSWSRRCSASGPPTASQCGQMVRRNRDSSTGMYLTHNMILGWLMTSISALSLFNVVVLLWPPQVVSDILNLMPLPFGARTTLLFAAMANVVVSIGYEQWGAQRIAGAVGAMSRWRKGRRRVRKAYKVVEGGMH